MTAPVQAVSLYQLGDKYDIPPLRATAARRLSKSLQPLSDVEAFVDVVYAIDKNTNPKDSTLLDIVMPMMKEDLLELVKVKAFSAMLSALPDVNIRLLTDLHQVKHEKLDSKSFKSHSYR